MRSSSRDARRDNFERGFLRDLLARVQAPAHFVILAGGRYRAEQLQPVRDTGHEIELPLQSLTTGRQLSWLTGALA